MLCDSRTSENEPQAGTAVVGIAIIWRAILRADLTTERSRSFAISGGYLSLLSRRYAVRVFTEFVLYHRITLAIECLNEGMPIKETAESCGYHSVSYFARHFKRETGYPPARYVCLFGVQ